MFSKFKYERIPLSLIELDDRNPRIVTQTKPASNDEILRYFFEHEDLAGFLKKIAAEGRNPGAERPYVVKVGTSYVVIEGNTRIATYKLLTGQLQPPEEYAGAVPHIPTSTKEELLDVDCSIAPSRDAMLPIMANVHFGLGDKTRWGYLGSRKAVFDEWKAGKSIAQLASVFNRKVSQIRDLIIEYELYLAALGLNWTDAERNELLKPEVEFNPPVRFLQSTGHKSATGIDFDRVNLAVIFKTVDAKAKFRHLVRKLVINSEKGLSATSSYKEVFEDYVTASPSGAGGENGEAGGDGTEENDSGGEGEPGGKGTGGSGGVGSGKGGSANGQKPAKGALFNYPVTSNSALHQQLMREAKTLNTQTYPASGTALLRSIVEALLKTIIADQGANPAQKLLSLETALELCLSNAVNLGPDDKKILKEFKKSHLDHVNMGSHAAVVPNHLRLMAARDCIDQFIMRNI